MSGGASAPTARLRPQAARGYAAHQARRQPGRGKERPLGKRRPLPCEPAPRRLCGASTPASRLTVSPFSLAASRRCARGPLHPDHDHLRHRYSLRRESQGRRVACYRIKYYFTKYYRLRYVALRPMIPSRSTIVVAYAARRLARGHYPTTKWTYHGPLGPGVVQSGLSPAETGLVCPRKRECVTRESGIVHRNAFRRLRSPSGRRAP